MPSKQKNLDAKKKSKYYEFQLYSVQKQVKLIPEVRKVVTLREVSRKELEEDMRGFQGFKFH